ncbi:unnamed protein product [Rotaria sp. Silwood1]|nr:unnamed protein product [Rotaria sp. Silwood1]CAF1685798.1 unnamed protein product [Rotaria sp. Silwood1]CAF3820136.1 unnamed protein product [Rotaria sp. Silwood1]
MRYFYLNGIVQPATTSYCIWWMWYEFSLNAIHSFLMAWISIERHLFIFHNDFIRNIGMYKRRLLRIVPLLMCSMWGPSYNMFNIVISPMCVTKPRFDRLLCGLPCFLFTKWGAVNLFIDVISPVIVICIFNFALVIRVIHQKLIVVGRIENNWRRQRKMAFQLGTISFVYLAVWIPLSVAQIGEIYSPNFLFVQLDTFNFFVYIVPLITPMLCLISMPEVLKKFKTLIFRQRRTAIMPLNGIVFRQNNIIDRTRMVATTNL